MDKTVLSFKGQTKGAEGILITNSNYFTIEDLSIEYAAGDNLKISKSKNVIIRNAQTAWTDTISTHNGAYGIYLVLIRTLCSKAMKPLKLRMRESMLDNLKM